MRSLFLYALAIRAVLATEPAVLVLRGQEKMYNLEFAAADTLFDSLMAIDPKHPRAYFFKSSAIFYQILSGHNNTMTADEFMKWNDRTVEVAEAFGEKEANEAEADFYRGAAYGNMARYHGVNGDFVKAFYYAKRSQGIHKDLIEKDAKNYDAYLSVGMYNYYAAAAPKWFDIVGSIFGLSGDRALGIRQLETAYRQGTIARLEAQFFLANVYVEEGNYEAALEYFSDLSARFPENPYLYNQVGMIQYYLDAFEPSKQTFKNALARTTDQTRSAEMFAGYFLGRMAKLENDYDGALELFKRSIAIGNKRRLFKLIDGWVIGAAMYQQAEVYELSGDRRSAVLLYEKARDDERSGKGVIQACKNRLQYPINAFEIDFIKKRHRSLVAPNEAAVADLTALLGLVKKEDWTIKFVPSIEFYAGRALTRMERFGDAIPHLEKGIQTFNDGEEKWREPQAQWLLALCYTKTGRGADAKPLLKKLAEGGDYPDANRMRFKAARLLEGL